MISAVKLFDEIYISEDCSGMTGGETMRLEAEPVRRLVKEPIAITLHSKGKKKRNIQYLRIN